MSALTLEGPYRLMVDEVRTVTTGVSCGVYALGALRGDGVFAVSFVGASYERLDQELCGRIGTAPHFKLIRHTDPERAFLDLCRLFHAFHPSGNVLHPERPRASHLGCPICDLRTPRSPKGPARR